MKSSVFILLCIFPFISFAELIQLSDEDLSKEAAQKSLEIDIDLSNVSFVYNYKNNANPNEQFWISGADTSGDLVQIKGITVDIADLPGQSKGAIIIGAPSEIRLSNVKTGDYYITRGTSADPNAPPDPTTITTNNNRKLFGLSWNTNIGIDFPEAGAASVESHTFVNAPFQAGGNIVILTE